MKSKLEYGSNPDPKLGVRYNLKYGLNPDPKIRTDRLVFFKIEPCLKMDSKNETRCDFLEKEWYLLGWLA